MKKWALFFLSLLVICAADRLTPNGKNQVATEESSAALPADSVNETAPPEDDFLTPHPIRPTVEPALSDQEYLELSALEDSAPSKNRAPDNSPAQNFAPIPTTPSMNFPKQDDSQELAQDDGRSIFAALSENPKKDPPSNSLSGAIARRPISNNNSISTDPTPTPAPSSTPDNALPWVHGQSRGYAMLYALHPRARSVVEKQVATLLRARVREPYISVLVDGTFDQEFDYLRTVIERLSADGRRLTLGLYITNGPTMRIWDKTPIRTAFSTIEPSEFRRRIQWDERTRNTYAELVDQSRQLFEFNLLTSRSNQNIAIPMLEDNLDRNGWVAARSLAAAQIGSFVKFARNPCEGCYDGNDGEPLDDLLEHHRTKYFEFLRKGDGFTLDGLGFTYPDTTGQTGLTPQRLNELIDSSLDRGLGYFGLWRHAWQGVIPNTANVHPDQRNYIPSTDIEADFEISALRRGLSPEETK